MSEQDYPDDAASPPKESLPPSLAQLPQHQGAIGGGIEAERIKAGNVVSGVQYIETQIIQQGAVKPYGSLTAQTKAPLFMAADLPADVVMRQQEFEALKQSLLVKEPNQSTARTVALYGAGGYGKTTLALLLCHDPEVRAAFPDGILWVTLGEKPVNVVARIEELVELLGGEQLGLISVDAATAKLRDALADHSSLLVIDDVWRSADLSPFLQGGSQCARLVTTRNEQVIPLHAVHMSVDAMLQSEAIQVLQTGLQSESNLQALEPTFQRLSAQLGAWPLLLTLANGVLQQRVKQEEPLQAALDYLQRAYEKHGVTAFDARDADARNEAVAKTLEVSLEQLKTDEIARYRELAIFPEHNNIPLSTVQRLWQTTGRWDDLDSEDLCQRLFNLSLLQVYNLNTRFMRLHDVVRNYLQSQMAPHLPTLHRQFLDSYGLQRWSDLSPQEPYLWQHLAEHLIAAERVENLVATMRELGYLSTKVLVCGVSALERDFALVIEQVPNETSLVQLRRCVVRNAHLLRQGKTPGEVETIFVTYCGQLEGRYLDETWAQEITGPYLTAWHPLPGLGSAAIVRTLIGHAAAVMDCAISADGSLIVSASADGTLKVWDAHTGAERLSLTGHTATVNGCTISTDGSLIVSASDDGTLKVWDAHTGAERLSLTGHTDRVMGCAISADGSLIVSASYYNGTLKVWDAHTGTERLSLKGHTAAVNDCAISADGSLIVSASWDGTLKVWDAHIGTERLSLTGHTAGVLGCAISADGSLIVSASADGTLKVWDAHSGTERLSLTGHTAAVNGCTISTDGRLIVSASADKTLKAWDSHSGNCVTTFYSDGAFYSCVWHPDGVHLVAAGDLGVYFLQFIR